MDPYLIRALQRLSPEFCPHCQIDFFTNPNIEIRVDILNETVTIRCDCRKGAYGLTHKRLEDLYQLI